MAIYSYILGSFISLHIQKSGGKWTFMSLQGRISNLHGKYWKIPVLLKHGSALEQPFIWWAHSVPGCWRKVRDIDIHIYTDRLDVGESFSVIRELAERLPLQEIQYRNLIHTEEECMEWHALYKDREQNTWKFDMIHIRKGSRYDGVVEKVTAAIAERLTPEIRKTILQIKFDVPDGVTIPGIEIYHAVFTGGVRTYKELEEWRKTNQLADSLGWLP